MFYFNSDGQLALNSNLILLIRKTFRKYSILLLSLNSNLILLIPVSDWSVLPPYPPLNSNLILLIPDAAASARAAASFKFQSDSINTGVFFKRKEVIIL